METKFSNGTQVPMPEGCTAVVEEWLAEGAQGDIYRARYRDQEKALKWYKPGRMGKDPAALYNSLAANVKKGPPDSQFLWPQALSAQEEGSGRFGYIMDLLPQGYCRLSDFLLRKRSAFFKSRIAAADAALQVISVFWALHDAGYSYQDLDGGSFFINPEDSSILARGDGRLAPSGTDKGLAAKPRYMAPEIVMKECRPDQYSDFYSMALVLFILFFRCHPLEGKRALQPVLTPEMQKELYITNPLFIMDSDHPENAPHSVVHRQVRGIWQSMPEYLQKLFLRAFTSPKQRDKRPKTKEWVEGLLRYRSGFVSCRCGNEVYMQEGQKGLCSRCDRTLRVPFRLEFSDYSIPGAAGTELYGWQMERKHCRQEALAPVGRIVAGKSDTSKLALKNMGRTDWCANVSGKVRCVKQGHYLRVINGVRFWEKNSLKPVKIEENNTNR